MFHVVVMVEEVGSGEVQVTLLAFFGSVMVVDVGSKLPGPIQHFAAWGANLKKVHTQIETHVLCISTINYDPVFG